MTVKKIPGYISYMDCQSWLAYFKETGGAGIKEKSAGFQGDVPMEERVGGILGTVSNLHISRFTGKPMSADTSEMLELLGTAYSEEEVPDAPIGTDWTCIFYLGKLDDTYQGEPDRVGDKEISPEFGDIVFFDLTENYVPGPVSEGINPRWYAFWAQK